MAAAEMVDAAAVNIVLRFSFRDSFLTLFQDSSFPGSLLLCRWIGGGYRLSCSFALSDVVTET